MTVTAMAARALLLDLSMRGIAMPDVLAGMTSETDLCSNDHIDDALFEDLLTQAVALTGDPAFGLTWARQARPGHWGLIYQLSAVAPTFFEAMAAVARFLPAYSSQVRFALVELPDRLVVSLVAKTRTGEGLRVASEFAMGMIWDMFRGFVGPDAYAHCVRFAYPQPPYRDEYDRAFGAAVHFDQDVTALELPMELARRRQPHEDPALWNILQARAQVSLVTSEALWVSRVAAYLRAAAPESLPDISAVARHFGMSVRGLRRRLAAEDRSFSSIADDVRAQSGIRWLTESETSVKEIAYKLGFSRASAFQRAFKRWTGRTPSECRATHRARLL